MKNDVKKKTGRPSNLDDKIIERARAYADGGFRNVPNKIPSIAGLAFFLGKSRECMYEWARQSDVFSGILDEILRTQEMLLLDGGLGGDFNAVITKMILTKHGYSDKQETDIKNSDCSLKPQFSASEVKAALLAASNKV